MVTLAPPYLEREAEVARLDAAGEPALEPDVLDELTSEVVVALDRLPCYGYTDSILPTTCGQRSYSS